MSSFSSSFSTPSPPTLQIVVVCCCYTQQPPRFYLSNDWLSSSWCWCEEVDSRYFYPSEMKKFRVYFEMRISERFLFSLFHFSTHTPKNNTTYFHANSTEILPLLDLSQSVKIEWRWTAQEKKKFYTHDVIHAQPNNKVSTSISTNIRYTAAAHQMENCFLVFLDVKLKWNFILKCSQHRNQLWNITEDCLIVEMFGRQERERPQGN